MLLLLFCFGAILGSFVTLIIILYWESLVERILLPPAKRHETPKIIDLEVRDAENPKVWLGCLLQFLFAELKDTEKIQKWFREKLIIEVEELKEKLPSRIVKDIRLNKFGLGTQPPIISNVKLSSWKTNKSKDVVEEVALRCDVRYAGEFYVSLDALILGQDAFIFIRLRQLVGNIEIRFSRQPFTHWSLSFTDEPQMILDTATQLNGRAVPQLATIMKTKIKQIIRRRHVLPNFKIRFPPFFPRPMGQPAPFVPFHTSSSTASLDLAFSKPRASDATVLSSVDVHMAAFSRLPPSSDSEAVLFFTLTMDSVPFPRQFSHVESFLVSVNDPNAALGILFISSLFSVDAIDLTTRKFSLLQGYYISAVVADSPAEKAGIKPGGVLVSVDGIALSSVSSSVDNVLRKSTLSCKNGIVRLEICNIETPPCQLIPFCGAMTPDSVKDLSTESALSAGESLGLTEPDSSFTAPAGPESTIRYRHRKNLSSASVATMGDANKHLPVTAPKKLALEEINSQPISRSSSDTNLAFQLGTTESVKSEAIEIRPTSLYSPVTHSKTFSATSKDLKFLAEKSLRQVANLPPSLDNCVVLRYCDACSDEDHDQPDIMAGEVMWTQYRPYPSNSGVSTSMDETLTFSLPTIDENQKSQAFLNVVSWIGVPESHENGDTVFHKKWKRLHAVSYAVFDLASVLEELCDAGKTSVYVRRTTNLYPFASISSPLDADVRDGSGKAELSLQTQRGFAPELCFGDVSVGFTIASDVNHLPPDVPPFTIYRHVLGSSRQSQPLNLSKSASLRIPEKLKKLRENCDHELVQAVSSRSQPCTVCSKSLGILQRLARSHAPLTCLRCGLLCHPRCAPVKSKMQTLTPGRLPQKSSPSESELESLGNSARSATISHSLSYSTLKSSADNISSSPNSGTVSRLKKLVTVAREKAVAKAGPKLAQKWRDLKNRSSRTGNATSAGFVLDDENVEMGEDVDTLLELDNQNDTVVAEELIRAWAAKAAESPGAALEGSLAEALLSNGESDGLLFQLKNLGKELFAELGHEERRNRLESVIARLTEQLDEESERHADLKTQLKVARSEEASANSSGLMKKVKQNDNNVAASCEAQLNRCDQRIRSLCLLIVHYSAGLDDCVSASLRKSTLLLADHDQEVHDTESTVASQEAVPEDSSSC